MIITADDMGLGKTLQGISLMWTLLSSGHELLVTTTAHDSINPVDSINPIDSCDRMQIVGGIGETTVCRGNRIFPYKIPFF